MITHEEARDVLVNEKMVWNISEFAKDYIKQQEQLQAEHEALKKDVARYFDLLENYEDYTNEFIELGNKLSKVGNNNG